MTLVTFFLFSPENFDMFIFRFLLVSAACYSSSRLCSLFLVVNY
jgi:hypothetical protein